MPSSNSGLESILRLSSDRKPKSGHVLVSIDKSTGAIVGGSSTLGFVKGILGKTVVYDLITDVWADIYDIDQALKIFITKEETKLRFRLRVVARARNAEQIVRVLADPMRSPAEVLFKVVEDAIRRQSDRTQRDSPDTLVRRIAHDRENWQRSIEQTITDRIGLEAELIFELGADAQRSDLPEITIRHFDVRTKDAPHRQVPITVHAILEPTGQRAHDPLPRSEADRERLLRTIVERAFRDEVTLYDYWFDRGRVESILTRATDTLIANTAYRARRIQVEPILPPVQREEKASCTVPWKGNAGREINFYVEAVLRLLPGGAGTYDSLHLKTREEWLLKNAASSLEIAMHGRDFYDLSMPDQREVAERVKEILRRNAAATGQEIDPIIANVVLPENKWLERQFLEVGTNQYKTKNDRGKAEFDISLELQFKTIRPLIDFIRYNSDDLGNSENYNEIIGLKLKEVTRKAAAHVMAQIEYVDYFATWEQWDAPFDMRATTIRGQKNYVYNTLSTAITRELQQRFDPLLCNVLLRRVDSEVAAIMKQIDDLGPLTVECEVHPSDIRSLAEKLTITLRYRPGDLDPERVPDAVRRGTGHINPVDIRRTLTGASRQYLHGLDATVIESLAKGAAAPDWPYQQETKGPVIYKLEEYASRLMITTYGFTVKLEDVEVSLSAERHAELARASLLTQAHQAWIDHTVDQISARMAHLKHQRAQNQALVDKLTDALLQNPRLNADDLQRYNLDESELQRAKEKIFADDSLLAKLLEESARRPLTLDHRSQGDDRHQGTAHSPRPDAEETMSSSGPEHGDTQTRAPNAAAPPMPERL